MSEQKWRVDNNGTGETVSIYAGEILIADVYDDVLSFGIVADHDAATRLADVESENTRLVAALGKTVIPLRGIVYGLPVGPCSDVLEAVEAALATVPAAPAGGSAEAEG